MSGHYTRHDDLVHVKQYYKDVIYSVIYHVFVIINPTNFFFIAGIDLIFCFVWAF